MKHYPLVSIIINNYNYGQFLRDAIDSALNQTYSQVEVIVVDDGSTDNSLEIIESYGRLIIPVLKENGGQASAFNAGFGISRGEIICLLDADDIFIKDKCELIVQRLIENPNYKWLVHKMVHIDSVYNLVTVREANQSLPLLNKSGDYTSKIKLNKIPFGLPATSSLVFSRELLNLISPVPIELKIGIDQYLRVAALLKFPVIYESATLSYQRIHKNNLYTGVDKRTFRYRKIIREMNLIIAIKIFNLDKNQLLSFYFLWGSLKSSLSDNDFIFAVRVLRYLLPTMFWGASFWCTNSFLGNGQDSCRSPTGKQNLLSTRNVFAN